MSNTLGKLFQVTSFGESHGPCIGVVLEGCPAGLPLNLEKIQRDLERRRPGQSDLTSPRQEADSFEILSGTLNNVTTGAPVCMMIRNQEVQSESYHLRRLTPRPGHADYTAFMKYGGFEDYRGGGRFSARITAGWVMAGSIAKQLLEYIGVEVLAHTVEIGGIPANTVPLHEITKNREKNGVWCADLVAAKEMTYKINEAKEKGDSVGGIIEGLALNLPVGLGEPVFDNLDGELAKALFALPAVKGIEFGAGFAATRKLGSQNNDEFEIKSGKVETTTNNAGGILGGLSNGMPLSVRVAFKPIASIPKTQKTIHLEKREASEVTIEGRFDPCPIPRAVVMVEAMMAIVLADFVLREQKIRRVLKS